MNLLHLQYFYVVAKEGGFTQASKALSIQQPAISRMVGQLEDSLGFPLFERVGRKVRLTEKGHEVFGYSKKIFELVDELKLAAGALHGLPKGPLKFGAAEPIASHFVPPVLKRLLDSYPDIYPSVYSAPASSLFERIKNGELEFGLFFHTPELPAGLKLRTLKTLRFYLVVRKDLSKNKKVLESFIGSREIDDQGTKSFPTLAKLRKRYPEARIKVSSNNITAHREMVMAGLGVAVLPDFLVREDLKKGKLADVLPGEELNFDLKLIERVTSVPTLNAQKFLEESLKS